MTTRAMVVRLDSSGPLEFYGRTVRVSVEEVEDPQFLPDAEHRNHVVVKVDSFSSNYRDRSLLLRNLDEGVGGIRFGSEFAGTIESVGDGVTEFSVGDRVVSTNSNALSDIAAGNPGIPSSSASCRQIVVAANRVLPVPDSLDIVAAGGMSIGPQTAGAMIRRAQLTSVDRVLITAAGSSTSLFIASLLKSLGCRSVTGLRTGTQPSPLIDTLYDQIITLPPGVRGMDHPPLREHVEGRGQFTVVFDPFFDVYLVRVSELIQPYGRYITCGLSQQHEALPAPSHRGNMQRLFTIAILQNLTLIGNCLGSRRDHEEALSIAGMQMSKVVTGRYGLGQEVDFLQASLIKQSQIGKSVYCF